MRLATLLAVFALSPFPFTARAQLMLALQTTREQKALQQFFDR